MNAKKIWSFDTALKIAAAKTLKYGVAFVVADLPGGGFQVVAA